MKKYIITLFLLAGIFTAAVAQKSADENLADKKMAIFNYADAIDLYNKSANLSTEGLKNLAVAYLQLNRFQDCTDVYANKLSQSDLNKEDKYNYILALKGDKRYSDAAAAMKKFAAEFPQDLRSKSYLANQKDFNLMISPDENVQVANLDFNTSAVDFGPAYLNDKVVFASTLKNFLFIKRDYVRNQKPYLNLYQADINGIQFENIKRLGSGLNKKWHEADACFYDNGTKMAFTQNNYADKSSDGSVNLKIFFSELKDGAWSQPVAFYLNNKEYSVGHPSVTEDGKVMYFASDMPGGNGGSDIYKIEKQSNGDWGKAVNLGKSINTEADELFPFWHEQSNSIYFASKGHLGLGGLDIYVSEDYGNNQYEPAFNLGAPINSNEDDFALITENTQTSGFFSSNRSSGKGDDDIYSFTDKMPDYLNTVLYDFVVLDRKSGQPINQAAMTIAPDAKTTNAKGNVQFELKKGAYQVNTAAVAYNPNQKQISVKPPRRGKAVVRDTVYLDLAIAQKIVLKNIYYDFDKWDILPESAIELDKVVALMSANPDVKIDLTSHTDARGTDAYNLKLSQLRAQSAKNYLVSKGIKESRINAKGMGETQLLNNCDNDTECSPAEHRQNRRTEIFIPEIGKGENVNQIKGDYSDGSADHGADYSSRKKHGSIFKIKL